MTLMFGRFCVCWVLGCVRAVVGGNTFMTLVRLHMVLSLPVKFFGSLPGPLQTVQRVEFWGVILALQASRAVHLGGDNLSVVRHVGRLLNCTHAFCLLELENDGDLIGLFQKMVRFRRGRTARVTQVMGHAE